MLASWRHLAHAYFSGTLHIYRIVFRNWWQLAARLTGLCLAKAQDLSCILSLLSSEKAEWWMAVLVLGSSYFVNPAVWKHLLNSRSCHLFLALTPSLPESFRYQLRRGRKKRSPWFPNILDFSVAFLLVTAFWFSFGKFPSFTLNFRVGGTQGWQSGPTSLHPND